jgi:bacillithiol synthase
MDCRALPLRQLPHQPKLFLDYLEQVKQVGPFFHSAPTLTAIKKAARSLDFPRDRREKVVSILRTQNARFGSSSETMKNLEQLKKGTVAIVSGQQVGLLGGPAYSIYKALTAIQVAAELTKQGISAVPIFWMATEDHDLEEVRHTTWFESGKLSRFELPVPADPGKPVGQISFGPEIETIAREAAEFLERQGGDLLARYVSESYRTGETYGSAFAKLFARLFAQHGLILLDPLDPALHKIAAPIYQHALAERDALNEKLLLRGKELDRAGYDAQVKVTAKSTLLFYLGHGKREVVTASAGKFHAGDETWSREELIQSTHTEPEKFSPNALFRPVVQDFLLPTVAYVGGPAEISYFAQSEVIFEKLLGRMPVLLPRAGFTLVDARAAKLLKKYGLKVDDVWTGAQELRHRMESRSVVGTFGKNFERSRKALDKMLTQLGKQIVKVDPTLKGSVDRSWTRIEFHLEKLRRKTGRAQDRKVQLLSGHEQYLESLLHPHKGLQERDLCLLPFLARWGAGAIGELQKCAGAKKLGQHFIVRIP